MTREEAIEIIECGEISNRWGKDGEEVEKMAIKALKQEPCEDAVSREAVLKIIDGWYEQNRDTDNIEDLIVLITYMDSVNPQKPICPSAGVDCEDCPAYEPKTGHWIRVDKDKLKCPECEVVHFIAQYPQSAKINYCPNCGAKMVEPQENNYE